MSLYHKIFEDAYLYMKQNLKPKMELLECNYIMQVGVQKNKIFLHRFKLF